MKIALLFGLLWTLLGNPFLALLVLLAVLYFLDRRFVGLTPSFTKPLRRRSRIAALRRELDANPSNSGSRLELARLQLERKRYAEARSTLEPLRESLLMEDSAEFWDDYGTSLLHTGREEEGEAAIRKALALNPRVKYGAPHLRLAALKAKSDKTQALAELEAFSRIQSSSCEGYYRMGKLLQGLDRKADAKAAFEEGLRLYRQLPKYKRRQERRWALLCSLGKNAS
ncbi:tetratricopeptide repeat protein [Paenibacillus pasadenensis]|uniref:Tetratricopeptide TPR_4 n=1 Tax=Paenibacillus pasadenensis TaxID=217090 RepID=A0A2N5N4F9_9BACL|nr:MULTISPECIES: tetratricopeptide repeat protein [Paenibacillus]PLT45200.1 Tetratricopeptide TPR_4 [Paenibacillus pasadenensis]QGG55591.1 tetratricopeptide repeat protein [Paenibacillus sp. B01]